MSNWVTIAEEVASRYHHYDGFVVIHGTDTMRYVLRLSHLQSLLFMDLILPQLIVSSLSLFSSFTASALSFMF